MQLFHSLYMEGHLVSDKEKCVGEGVRIGVCVCVPGFRGLPT